MPQGAVKKQNSGFKSARSQPAGPKKGKRSIAPRKKALVRESGIRKKYSAGLTAKTERTLAAKAGHLELLAGGKKGAGSSAGAGAGRKAGAGAGTAKKSGNAKSAADK